jgi:hypothetical protein
VARKIKISKEPAPTVVRYWENRLRDAGLSMRRGAHEWLKYRNFSE